MASYSTASLRARDEAMDQLNRDARRKYGYEYVVDYVAIPGSYDYRHTMTLDYSFQYEEQHTSNEHVADDVTYDVYSDGSKVETSRSAVYKDITYTTVETAHDTAEYHFFVLKDPTYRNRLNNLANSSYRKAYLYDTSKGSDENVNKAKSYLSTRTLFDSYICGGGSFILLIYLFVHANGNSSIPVIDGISYMNALVFIFTIATGITHLILRKKEDAYERLASNVGKKAPFYFTKFQFWYFLILNLLIGFTGSFLFESFMTSIQLIVAIVNVALSVIIWFALHKGYSYLDSGVERNKEMIKLKKSAGYNDYVSQCENFCRNCLR